MLPLPKKTGILFFIPVIWVLGCSGPAHADPSTDFWRRDLTESSHEANPQVGLASWYGGRFHGRKTASGERYDKYAMTCASRHLPFGTMLEVTNLKNGKTAVVRVNDRGPYLKRRVLDFSYAVAKELGFLRSGETEVAFTILSSETSTTH